MADIPLRRREHQRLEFKGRGALAELSGIGREVVAMLNAEGGEIWVGVREDNGIAVEIEPLADVELERRRLRDYLVDAVEPAPASDEVRIEPARSDGGATVLRIEVRPEHGRGPYALVRKTGRHFLLRAGDRLRPMARVELERAFRTDRTDEDQRRLEEQLASEVADLQKTASPRLWLALAPIEGLDVDLHKVKAAAYLRDPTETGSRRSDLLVSFTTHPQATGPRVGNGSLVIEVPEWFRFELRRRGDLRVELSTRALIGHLGNEPDCLDGLQLLELITSVFRVAARILANSEAAGASAPALGQLALFGIRGVKLRPGSAFTSIGRYNVAYALSDPHPYEDADLVIQSPLRFTVGEIREEPDRCAFRMIRRVYEAFDFGEDALPSEFDLKTRRLILRE